MTVKQKFRHKQIRKTLCNPNGFLNVEECSLFNVSEVEDSMGENEVYKKTEIDTVMKKEIPYYAVQKILQH